MCGTIFEATQLPLTTWFLAMHLLAQAKNNVSALELKRHLGVRYKTAWLLKHKLMQVMSEREASRQLDGRVEIDDAYLGGELPGGKSGGCSGGMTGKGRLGWSAGGAASPRIGGWPRRSRRRYWRGCANAMAISGRPWRRSICVEKGLNSRKRR